MYNDNEPLFTSIAKFVSEVEITQRQKQQLLDYLKCSDTDRPFNTLKHWLKCLNENIQDFKANELGSVKPYEQLKDFEEIEKHAALLRGSLNKLSHNQKVFEQNFRLEQNDGLFDIDKFKSAVSVDSLNKYVEQLQAAANSMNEEIDAKSAKKPIESSTVQEMVRLTNLYGLPNGRTSVQFCAFLTVVFEILNIDYDASFEGLIRDAHRELKRVEE